MKDIKDFKFEDLTPEEQERFYEDYSVCDVETAPSNKKEELKQAFEKRFKKPYQITQLSADEL